MTGVCPTIVLLLKGCTSLTCNVLYQLQVQVNNEFSKNSHRERLDRYLAQQLPHLSRSRIQQLIEQGNVQLNDVVCNSKKATVQIGDKISLSPLTCNQKPYL